MLDTVVYPRVGGATSSAAYNAADAKGLSPRGRGNLEHLGQHPGGGGSIPAWAGQPDSCSGRTRPPRVYPRVGGATSVVEWDANAA